MLWNDDEDLFPSFSDPEAFTRADRGKLKKLKEKIQQKTGQDRSTDVDKTELQSKVNLHHLQEELAGKTDEETKRKREAEEKAKRESKAPKTKTIKELEESAIGTAHEQPDSDTMIQRQETLPPLSDEETTPEPG